jgi:tol-pal system protein YbgF
LLASVAALSGCWVPIERGRQMEARIQRLEVENVEQRRKLDEQRELLRDRVAKADQKIREVQTKIDELNQAARRSGADLGVSLNNLQDEFARVKGDLEVSQHRLDTVEKSLKAIDADTESRFAALKGQGALDAHEARQKIQALPRGDDKGALFALAQKTAEAGDEGVAREIYEEYVRRWPNDAKSAEAGFRAGDAYFGQKRWREALLAYGRVAEGFPKSDRAPDAMLGAAESMIRLDMKDDAAAVLGQLLERYPKSDVAPKAKARLAEIAPPPPPKPEKPVKPARSAEKPARKKP